MIGASYDKTKQTLMIIACPFHVMVYDGNIY